MNDTIFRVLALVIIVIAAGISSYHRKKADRVGGDKISLREEGLPITLALRLMGLVMWLSVFAYLINPAWMAWSQIDLPDSLRWMGAILGIAADAMVWWVFRNLGNNVTPTVVTRSKHTLVTSGPYRFVRHPLYVTGFIAYLGFALLAENWFIVLLNVLGLLVLTIRLTREETHLIDRFGDGYRDYMRRTGKFLPKVKLF